MAVTLITHINRYLGVSGDAKPTDAPAGSLFFETDKGHTYEFDGAATWYRKA